MTPHPPRDLLGLYRTACGAWLGIALYLGFGITKTLFEVYSSHQAGEITALLFPPYYIGLYIAGSLAAIAMALSHKVCSNWKPCLILVLFALIFIGTVDFKITPVMQALSLPAERPQFARLHGLSMILNLVALIAVAVALVIGRRLPTGVDQVGEEETAS